MDTEQSKRLGDSDSCGTQRVYEYTVEPVVLQDMPDNQGRVRPGIRPASSAVLTACTLTTGKSAARPGRGRAVQNVDLGNGLPRLGVKPGGRLRQ